MKLNIKSKWSAPLALLATAATVAGCGGGGGSGSAPAPTPQNTAPVLSAIAAQTINQDTSTPALAFTVSDDGGLGAVIVSVSSSDKTLIPSYGLALGGSGANRTVTVVPAEDATGTANVSVTAVDARGLSTSVTFPLRLSWGVLKRRAIALVPSPKSNFARVIRFGWFYFPRPSRRGGWITKQL